MKNTKQKFALGVLVFALFSLIITSCCEHKPENQPENAQPETSEMSTVELKVDGMTCTNCENHITKAVTKLEGVSTAKLSHVKENAVIEYDKWLRRKIL
ncbi:MAG: heavy metal-associated domain-containing protein [Bacteroidota bacterium]|nr:heavy metal-associated domain-containing protein [Bacteroidota bacterium]